MRVVRGRGETPSADRELTGQLVEETVHTEEPVLRVWTPHRTVVFGRRDRHHPDYDVAREIATAHDFHPMERSVGGHAVAYTGSTVAFVRIAPIDDARIDIEARYDETIDSLSAALAELAVQAERGEPAGAFCPGCHSLSATGKIAGLAQRVKRDVAIVSGIVVVRDHEAIADVLAPIYDALALEFDPDAVGSLERAGGIGKPQTVVRTIETALSSDNASPEQVREA